MSDADDGYATPEDHPESITESAPPPASPLSQATTRSQAARIAVSMAQTTATAEAAQLRATANAAAYKANESWVDNIRAEDGPILEDRMGNSEAWIADTKRQCLYRDCLTTLTTAPTSESSAAEINADRNVALLMKKTISPDLLPYVEHSTAAGTFAAVIKLAPNKDLVKRRILAEAHTLTCSNDITTYILAHQKAHGRLLTLDPEQADPESHPSSHLSRLLDGLSTNLRSTNSYLLSKWSDRSGATKADVFKVGEELITNSGKPAKSIFAGSATSDATNVEGQCPKHRKSNHNWSVCDLNPHTTDPEGRDRRRARRDRRHNGDGSTATPTAAAVTVSETARLTSLEKQLATLTEHLTKAPATTTTPTATTTTPTATALMTELATQLHALNAVNNSDDSSYTTIPRTLIDSGASNTFVTSSALLSHPTPHKTSLRTAEGNVSHTTHAGKFQATTGHLPLFLPALAVPRFQQNLLSVGQLADHRNVVFTKRGAYLTPRTDIHMDRNTHYLGPRGADNLYTSNIPNHSTLLALAAPVQPHKLPQQALHDTMNHSHPQAISQFTRQYPHAAQEIMKKLPQQSTQPCIPCIVGKSKRAPFPPNYSPPTQPLDAISTDTTGPITPSDMDGNRYLQIIVDGATGHTSGQPMKRKSEATQAIMSTIQRLQTTLGKKVKRYHADNAAEQHTIELTDMLEKQGTTITRTSPNTSQQNAFAERRFSTIFNATRAALAHSGLPLAYWSIAALDAIDKMNYLPMKRKTGNNNPPNATLYKQLDPKHLLPFGQRGYIINTTPKKPKLQPRAIAARYLRAVTHAQYLVLLPSTNITRLIRPSEFIITSLESPLPVTKQDNTTPTVSIETEQHQDINSYKPPPQHEALRANATIAVFPDPAADNTNSKPKSKTGQAVNKKAARRHRARRALKALAALAHSVAPPPPSAPRSLADVAGRLDAKAWYDAWDAELQRHDTELHTWTYEDPLPTDKPLPYLMGFKAKTNVYGGLERCKVRCAIRGDRMRPGLDFDETRTASHMPSQAGRRLLLSAAAAQDHSIASCDVPGAYMRAPNDPKYRVTMQQPPRADGSMTAPGKICVMRRAMQGDPAANAQWDSWRDHWLRNWGWTKVLAEPSMFWTTTKNGVARMEVDNDDFLVTAPTENDLHQLTAPLKKAWGITVQKLTAEHSISTMHTVHMLPSHDADKESPRHFQHVGLKITKLTCGGIQLSNPKIILKLLSEHGLTNCNPVHVPYVANADITARRPDEDRADKKAFQKAVGTLRFIADTTHPAIAWISGVLGRHLHDPAPRHVAALKPIIRYLSSRVHQGPLFTSKGPLALTCYTDSDYAACRNTRRSTTGMLLLASLQPIVWASARQATVSHSSTEAEFIAADLGARTLTWMATLADQLHIPVVPRPASLRIDDKPATKYHDRHIVVDTRNDLNLLIDNKGAFDIAHTNAPSKRTKHLDLRHFYIQQQVHTGVIKLTQVPSTEQKADFLTKPVGRVLFKTALRDIGYVDK